MAYPVLAAQSTWFAPTVSTVKRANITEIEIMDSYTPDASVTVTDSWDASAAKDGSITCYVIGTKLIIAGNGSGKIAMNEDSSYIFSDSAFKDFFMSVTSIINVDFLESNGVKKLKGGFFQCNNLLSLNIGSWNTSNVNDFTMLFGACKALKTIDISQWDVGNVESITNMCTQCIALTTLDLSRWNVSNVKKCYAAFADCSNLITIGDTSSWDTSSCTTMHHMFENDPKIKYIDVSNWDVSKVETLQSMFSDCSSLTNLDVSQWDLSSCTNIDFMFYGCSSLKEIDVSNWDVSYVKIFDHFAAHANLKRKGIENWNTSSATNMNALFHNCAEEELDLSGWDVSNVQFFCQMFENSPNLKRIKGLEKWNTSAGLGFDGMFERCYKLEEVDLSSFNTTKAKNNVSASANGHKTLTLQNMFISCNNLKKVTLGPNFSINGDGTNTAAGNKLILPTPSTDYISGADGMWYTINGDSYAPNGVKDRTKETYYASFDIVADLDIIVKNGNLIDAARAIREKNGTTNRYTPSEFGAAIRAIVPRAIAGQAVTGQVNVGEV